MSTGTKNKSDLEKDHHRAQRLVPLDTQHKANALSNPVVFRVEARMLQTPQTQELRRLEPRSRHPGKT